MLVGLYSFTAILGLSILTAIIILAIGNGSAIKTPDTPGKLASYACGEDIPPTKVRVNVENFFLYAVYFMIFDVLGFVLATTIAGSSNLYVPLAYAGVSIIPIVILTARRS